MGTRRFALLALAASLVGASGCGDGTVRGLEAGERARPAPNVQRAVAIAPALPAAQPTGPREVPPSVLVGYVRRDAALTGIVERRRQVALAKARRSRTVKGALRRAVLARHITRREQASLRAEYVAARRTLRRLSGTPRAELATVLGHVDALARSRRLTAGRFHPVFLVLRRNREFWARHAPRPCRLPARASARDPAVFQYYPGQGIQLQQLASWGRLNAKLGALPAPDAAARSPSCGAAAAPDGRPRRQRGPFLAWESYFSFGGGTPPWISGMTQGTAVQALARGASVFDDAALAQGRRAAPWAPSRRRRRSAWRSA